MNKTLQQEKDFLLLIESHKRVIYTRVRDKFCSKERELV